MPNPPHLASSLQKAPPAENGRHQHNRLTTHHKRRILPAVVLIDGPRALPNEQPPSRIGHGNLPSLRLPFPYEEEKDKEIMLEMQRRFVLERGN